MKIDRQWVVGLLLLSWVTPAAAQFGGGGLGGRGGFGGGGIIKSKPTQWQNDPAVKADYSPIIVANPATKRAIERVVAVLDEPFKKTDIHEMPLNKLVPLLRKQTGPRITLDERALSEASIGQDMLSSCDTADVSPRNVLDTLLASHGLGWYPGQEGIVITTKEEQETHLFVVIYPVVDLVSSPDGADFDSLKETIISTIQPNSWHDGAGGEGPIGIAINANTGTMTITVPWDSHEQIDQLIKGLRQAKLQQGILGLRGPAIK